MSLADDLLAATRAHLTVSGCVAPDLHRANGLSEEQEKAIRKAVAQLFDFHADHLPTAPGWHWVLNLAAPNPRWKPIEVIEAPGGLRAIWRGDPVSPRNLGGWVMWGPRIYEPQDRRGEDHGPRRTAE